MATWQGEGRRERQGWWGVQVGSTAAEWNGRDWLALRHQLGRAPARRTRLPCAAYTTPALQWQVLTRAEHDKRAHVLAPPPGHPLDRCDQQANEQERQEGAGCIRRQLAHRALQLEDRECGAVVCWEAEGRRRRRRWEWRRWRRLQLAAPIRRLAAHLGCATERPGVAWTANQLPTKRAQNASGSWGWQEALPDVPGVEDGKSSRQTSNQGVFPLLGCDSAARPSRAFATLAFRHLQQPCGLRDHPGNQRLRGRHA